MKLRTLAVAAVLCLSAASFAAAADSPFIGTWKLNEAKSTIPAGAAKNTTVTYVAASGGMTSVTTDGVDSKGQPAHSEWTGTFDGKPYPVTGMATGMSRTVKAKGDRELEVENLLNGKSVAKAKTEVAKDGKSRTLDIDGTTADGKKYKAKFVYDKQ